MVSATLKISSGKRGKHRKPQAVSMSDWHFSPDLLSAFGLTDAAFTEFQRFHALPAQDKVATSRDLIHDTILESTSQPSVLLPLAFAESESLLKGYATLDDEHRTEIAQLMENISGYLQDKTRKRPFNALMLAAPGAGKSHFIQRLAAAMKADRVQAVGFNMATMQAPDDIAQPLDELRNLKVNDRFPLLFLDEFDSDPARYASLLPLLWDGEIHVGHRDLKLGKAVIVLAGSSPDLPKTMAHSSEMRLITDGTPHSVPAGKLVDLLSRINGGVINIPDFDLRTASRDRRVDKICVTISLLRARFGTPLRSAPRALLRFIGHTTFRYGVRSLAHLIDCIPTAAVKNGELSSEMGLPLGNLQALERSSLTLHLLDRDQGFGIVNRWKDFNRDRSKVPLEVPGPLNLLSMSRQRTAP